MSIPRYPEYKDSGVEWLEEVPSHWAIERNKRVFRIVQETVGNEPENFQLLSLTLRGVIPRSLDGKGKYPADFDSYQQVEPGNIVFCLFDIDETPRTVGLSEARGMITGAYTVAQALPGIDPRFVYYHYFEVDLRKGLRPFYTGLRKVVRPETFLNIEMPVPPLGEQAALCNFLDHETAKIDALIQEQQRLIKLLNEKRQAVISHAVTKGLDPSVPMKDSGVEWIGEVPAHWDVASLKRYWSVTDCKHLTAEFVDEGVALASIREVQGRYVNLEGAKKTTEYFYDQLIEGGRMPEEGDLIFSRNATVGEVAQVAGWHPPFAMGQDVCLLKKSMIGLSSDYLQLVLRSPPVTVQIENLMVGSTFKRVNVDDIRGLLITMPSQAEQEEIVRRLDSEVSKFDSLLLEAQHATSLLSERRSALISAAVTGKIDVRNWQPPADESAFDEQVRQAGLEMTP